MHLEYFIFNNTTGNNNYIKVILNIICFNFLKKSKNFNILSILLILLAKFFYIRKKFFFYYQNI